MIRPYRTAYNHHFTQPKYEAFLEDIYAEFGHVPSFRISETPVFIPRILKERLLEACEGFLSVINGPNFKEMTTEALALESSEVPAEDYTSRFIQFDFGICQDENGDPIPKLIELQGFPSLYFYQDFLAQKYIQHFDLPDRLHVHLNGLNSRQYIDLLRQEIIGDSNPKEVVLLEIEPEKQVTQIDFLCAERALGLKVLCITKIKKEGKSLYYLSEDGSKIQIKKIYNRVIFDELLKRPDLNREFYFKDEVDVEWVGHPNWFFRISKYTMPLLEGPYVPKSYYLNRLEKYPDLIENFVLKPLYSFSGAGVELHLNTQMLDAIKDKHNYILQEKIKYHPIIETPDTPAKCEIRMMCLYNTRDKKTRVINNLVRLSKGEMVGVRYNRDKDWVGSSVGFFED